MTCSDLIGAALLAAAEQVEYRHDTRPFLRVKRLAHQTICIYATATCRPRPFELADSSVSVKPMTLALH